MNGLLNFLSDFPCYQNEKNLILQIEEFLSTEYQIRPMLVFSLQESVSEIHLNKCRAVIGKPDRMALYSNSIIDQLLGHKDLMSQNSFSLNEDGVFYYYLKLGNKKNQFFFAIFSSSREIANNFLSHLSLFSSSHFKIIDRFDELQKSQELIHIDDVTGLYNQRKLYKDLEILVNKFKIENDPFCVLFIDIDHFKKVNDNYGHLVGTRLLENVARDIKGLLRDTDISYRYGGDEFVIILAGSDGNSGKIVGERILSKIKSEEYSVDIRNEKKSLRLSVSIGVAEFPTDAKDSMDVLAIADRMMYEAKESGRGLVFNTQDVFKSSLKKVVSQG